MDSKKELEEIVKEVTPIVESMKTPNSKIGVLTGNGLTEVDKYGTKVICLCGGLNGCGKWENYFSDLSSIIERLKKEGFHVWTINLDNDCLDDIFYLKLGISRKKKSNG